MPYIGNPIYQSAFVTDQFSGDGTTIAFTMSVAPAGTSNVLVVVSGVVQDPSTYGVVGNTLNFTAAPPSGTGNISCRYLGVPVTGVTTTAYRTVTEFTATAGQTTFTPASYNVGFINVYRNGVLLGSADYTATNGTTVVLATGATAGDLVTVESFLISSVSNAISNTAGSVSTSNIINGGVTAAKLASGAALSNIGSGGMSSAYLDSNAQYYGFKNRIINGGMVIDQRNAGASVTISSDVYTLDRWRAFQTVASKFSVQQNAGSVTPPAGFKNYLGVTSLSSYSVSSGDYFLINQVIEGYNIADLGWGTSSAATVTLSFWVRSSLTGTFGGALLNQSFNRTYPFTYTISSANTWTQISVTITGETSGTWGSTNDSGMQVRFVMGCGSARLAPTPNAWVSAGYDGPTGSTSVVGTNGATWYVTGVQLEKGSTATSFDYRPYGTELALCQRYYEKTYDTGTAIATNTAVGYYTICAGTNTANNALVPLRWKVEKRAAPTVTPYRIDGTANQWGYGRSGASGNAGTVVDNIGTSGARLYMDVGAAWTVAFIEGHYVASAEL